jgi:hypothetical protein
MTVAEAVEDAELRFESADFDGALEVLTSVENAATAFASTEYLMLLARVLRATSRYDAAVEVLRLARHDREVVSRAQTEIAAIAWTRHAYDEGIDAAVHALRASPGHRRARGMLGRLRGPVTPPPADAPTGGIAHGAFYASGRGNFGDLALPSAVREAFTTATGETSWLGIHVHQLFDDERLELVNAQRAMIVGGGGLFLPDTAPNGHSGWQWNVPQAQLERITVPLATFAVGYNLFDGQKFVGDRFRGGLLAMAERSVFLGLRNHGSIEQVRRLLPAHLHDRLRFVPCPTTILEHTHPGLPPVQEGTGTILLNVAFDRRKRRFHGSYPAFLAQIEKYVAAVEAAGSEVRCVAHAPDDSRIVQDLRTEYGRELRVDDLSRSRPEEGYALFRRADLVVGMRGHATMIPFGLGTPVLSIVSHPKMRYFLEDIERPEWGFEVGDPNLADRLLEHTTDVLQHNAERRQDIREIQARLAQPIFQAARDLVGS